MIPDLLFALLIIATPVVFFVVVPGIRPLVATALPAPKTAPALDERDLLDTDPREWVRQAEHAVEFEEGDKMDHMDSFMQMQRDIAPRFACVICGTYDAPHTHNLEEIK